MLKIKKTDTEKQLNTLDLNQFKNQVLFAEKYADSQQAIRKLKEKGNFKFPDSSTSF